MNVLAVDVETTTTEKGQVFHPSNKLVCYSTADSTASGAWHAEYLERLQPRLDVADRIVGFNIKFDLQWLHKEGITYDPKKVWDIQLGEFILSSQTHRFPSLDETCEKYGLGKKLDIVKTEYWDKGINTDEIPWDILSEYAALDAKLTLQCYEEQIKVMTGPQQMLCRLMSQDLSILRDMEWNGIVFDEQLCHVRAQELDDKISEINKKLAEVYPNVPINFNSNDHLSAFLYGGVVKEDGKEFVGFYKTGERAGQPKHKNVTIEHQLPRLYTPLKGSEMKKEGMFAVDEGTLRKLKGKKEIITMLLELSKMEKLNGTYYRGLITLREKMGWDEGILHGTFNQTTAATGRLSATKPNQQNFATELLDIFVSRYDD